MTGTDGFLSRWSRRKADAARRPRPEPGGAGAAPPPAPSEPPAAAEGEPAFDPACLPPLESIGAGSDIRAFLAAGVPAELRRAALRRAWITDPLIRDFVGLSENAWDFNAPAAASGFGAIHTETVRRLAERMIGAGSAPAPRAAPAEGATHPGGLAPAQRIAAIPAGDQAPSGPLRQADAPDRNDAVPRNDPDAPVRNRPLSNTSSPHGAEDSSLPRRHGGALPR